MHIRIIPLPLQNNCCSRERLPFIFSADSMKGYIDQLDFKVNDKTVKWEYDSANIDICRLNPSFPIEIRRFPNYHNSISM